jgi:hypothetical protein
LRGAKWVVGLGGDIDFILSRSQEPGWVGQMINWIIDPPAGAIAPLIVLGFLLIWLDVKRPWRLLRWRRPASLPIATSQLATPGYAKHSGLTTQVVKDGGRTEEDEPPLFAVPNAFITNTSDRPVT